MSQVPVDDLTLEGYEPPRVVQFSVFLDNRVGRMLELIDAFERHSAHVVGLSVIDSLDHAVVRIVTSHSGMARKVLQNMAIGHSETDVLVVRMREDHGLSELCHALVGAEVNIGYAYPLLRPCRGRGAIVIKTDERQLTASVLRRKLFELLGEADLRDPSDPSDPIDPADPNVRGN